MAPKATEWRKGQTGPLFVPFTLPGELVKVAAETGEGRAEPLAILEPSPERVTPLCQYFGACGGCALHLAWKREQIVAALASRGLEALVEEVRAVPLATRRRAAFALGRTGQGIAFGYRAARSTPSSTSQPARCSAPASRGSFPSSGPRLLRSLVEGVKRASPSQKPSRASM